MPTASVSVSPSGAGSVLLNGKTTNPVNVEAGREVMFSAFAYAGYQFLNWIDKEGYTYTANPIFSSSNNNPSMTAVFTKIVGDGNNYGCVQGICTPNSGSQSLSECIVGCTTGTGIITNWNLIIIILIVILALSLIGGKN